MPRVIDGPIFSNPPPFSEFAKRIKSPPNFIVEATFTVFVDIFSIVKVLEDLVNVNDALPFVRVSSLNRTCVSEPFVSAVPQNIPPVAFVDNTCPIVPYCEFASIFLTLTNPAGLAFSSKKDKLSLFKLK